MNRHPAANPDAATVNRFSAAGPRRRRHVRAHTDTAWRRRAGAMVPLLLAIAAAVAMAGSP